MNPNPSELSSAFARPGIDIEPGPGGLLSVACRGPGATARVFLHGAHAAEHQPAGHEPLLYMSPNSAFADGQPIRGGVPVCLPWFGPRSDDATAPMHGLVRTTPWTLTHTARDGDQLRVVLTTHHTADPRFPHDFAAELSVGVGATLELSLTVEHLGAAPARYEMALHTYLRVGDVQRVSVAGLEGVPYVDKTDSMRTKPGEAAAVRIASQTDRVYTGHSGACVVTDPVLARRVVVEKSGSRSTVLWNPWEEKSRQLADLGEGQWRHMLCVETANVLGDALTLTPGQRHTMTAALRAERL